MGFSHAELQSYRGKTLPDLLGPDTRLLIVGINPGLLTVAVQSHFGRRGNRFYPALYRAGIVDRLIDAADGFDPADIAHLKARGIGISNLVRAATARADELSREQLLAGAVDLEKRVRAIGPAVVSMLGITSYRVAFGRPKAVVGRQPETLGDAELWVVPNPSGLNAHSSLGDLAAAYRETAIAAGIEVFEPPPVDS